MALGDVTVVLHEALVLGLVRVPVPVLALVPAVMAFVGDTTGGKAGCGGLGLSRGKWPSDLLEAKRLT